GAVRPQEGEDLALHDVEVDALQRVEAVLVGLRQVPDGYDWLHGPILHGLVRGYIGFLAVTVTSPDWVRGASAAGWTGGAAEALAPIRPTAKCLQVVSCRAPAVGKALSGSNSGWSASPVGW